MAPHIDIIMLALARWDGLYSSTAYSIAKELSTNNRVFYIDNPFTIKDFFHYFRTYHIQRRISPLLFGENTCKKIDTVSDNFFAITPKLTFPTNWLSDGAIYKAFAQLNDRIVYQAIGKTIKDYQIKNYIFLNSFNPFYGFYFPKSFRPILKIYQSVDMIDQAPHIAKHGLRLENEMIRQSHITLTTSRQLYKSKAKISQNAFYLPNAADTGLFKKALTENYPKPIEVASYEKPIIGYTGHIDNRIDYDLLKQIATAHSDKILLLVGPIANKIIEKDLRNFENIILSGKKSIEVLPQYLQHFDCAIIPFKKNTLTSGIYPLKINEYLAAGKPVIATDFSEDIMGFSEVAYIARNNEKFVKYIQQSLEENHEKMIQKRIMIAEKNNWRARIIDFWEIVEGYMHKDIKAVS